MSEEDCAALARVQNALVNAQQIYNEQKGKLDRLITAGKTRDATNTLDCWRCTSQSFKVTGTAYSLPQFGLMQSFTNSVMLGAVLTKR